MTRKVTKRSYKATSMVFHMVSGSDSTEMVSLRLKVNLIMACKKEIGTDMMKKVLRQSYSSSNKMNSSILNQLVLYSNLVLLFNYYTYE